MSLFPAKIFRDFPLGEIIEHCVTRYTKLLATRQWDPLGDGLSFFMVLQILFVHRLGWLPPDCGETVGVLRKKCVRRRIPYRTRPLRCKLGVRLKSYAQNPKA